MSSSGRKKAILVIITILILIAIAATIFFVLRAKGFFQDEELPSPKWQFAGSAQSADDELVVAGDRSDKLESRLLKLCETEYGLAAWYRLPVRSEELPAERSVRFNSSDQLLYGRFLAEQKRMDEFDDWHIRFKRHYIYDNKTVAYIEINEQSELVPAAASFETMFDYISVLMTAYQSKPQKNIWQEIESLSDILLTDFADGIPEPDLQLAIPTVAPAPDPAATPTPIPVITPTPEPAPVYSLIRLASIDLQTINQLTEVDQKWQVIYEKWLAIVSDGLISEQLPLYALAVWPDMNNYLNFVGEGGSVDSMESIITTLHLAQAGAADQSSLRWINDQLLNNFVIYDAYNIIQGHPMAQIENPSIYGLTARLGRVLNDKTLYDKSINRLNWHTATSQRSDALDAIFRQDENDVVTIWAEDNLRALLAYK
ncbi:MAG: hypothetical protein GX028_01380 [Clostridiaceae bacterium]|nr:hypothetical protein [Clostridiaceae bacterium]